MKLKYRLLKVLLLTCLMVFLMNFAIRRHYNKVLNKDHVYVFIKNEDSVQFIDKQKIMNLLYKTSVDGKLEKIKDLNISEAKKELKTNPYISKGNIFVDLDGNVNVNINQKVPIARIKTPKGEFYLDNQGNKFPLSSDYSYPCMLVIGNILPSEYKKLTELCKDISVDKMFKNHIVGIEKDNQNSYNLLLNIEGVYIEFGGLENEYQKLANLKEFYKQYLDYVGFDAYKKISLKYDNQIVTTKR